MKEKIKKIWKWLLNTWRTLAEIGVVVWAIHGMWGVISVRNFGVWLETKKIKDFYNVLLGEGVNVLLVALFFYFSAVLVLYLLRKYERKN